MDNAQILQNYGLAAKFKHISDFMQAHPFKLQRMLNKTIKEITDIKEDIREKYGPVVIRIKNADYLQRTITTGIENLDDLLLEVCDTNEFILEICGPPAVGKSLLSHTICMHNVLAKRKVLYIDTKQDFRAAVIVESLKNKYSMLDISFMMQNILIERAFSFEQIVNILHELIKLKLKEKCSLVIIDSLSALWFLRSECTSFNVNYWLTKLNSALQRLNRLHGVAFILINLSLKSSIGKFSMDDFKSEEENSKRHAVLGKFWSKIPQIRLSMEFLTNCEKAESDLRKITVERAPYNETGMSFLVHIKYKE